MNMLTSELEGLNLDGQILYIIPAEKFPQLYEHPYIDHIRLMKHASLDSTVKRNMAFVDQHQDSFLFSVFLLPQWKSWFFHLLYKHGEDFVRVFLEQITCQKCHGEFYSANHMVSDLFFGIDEDVKHGLLNRYPTFGKKCPLCGSDFPRPSIWTEVISFPHEQPNGR